MNLKQIERLLNPHSIAVIGASNQPNRPGNAVMRNLLQGQFHGSIMPVSPNYESVCGVLAYKSIDDLPIIPDLAIICTRAVRVPAIVLQLGRKGVRNAIVIAAGLDNLQTAKGNNLQQQMLAIAKEWGICILGGNSLGLIVPALGLNASYAHTQALPGKIAFVSQSSAVCVTLLDWAKRRQIGFSYFVSLGDATDVGFAELIDFLGRDAKTSAILLYMDSIVDGRRFMSAARAASLIKPIIVIKTGTQVDVSAITLRVDPSHIGDDAVYDAAFRRAGMLRVGDLRELLAAMETLAYGKAINSEQLVIVANGNGPSAIAIDALFERGGRLAVLDEKIVEQLNTVIHSGGRAQNPINLVGDASPEIYGKVIEILLQSNSVDNLLIMHAPSALVAGEVYADSIIKSLAAHKGRKPNILVNWMGEDAAQAARLRFAAAGISSFRTPEGVVGAFMHMVQYKRNQKLLSETPDSVSDTIPSRPPIAQHILANALQYQQEELMREEAIELLNAYAIDTIPTKTALTPEEAAQQAQALGFPVALRILLPTVPIRSDVGSVVLNLNSQEEVITAAQKNIARVKQLFPDAVIAGFSLQNMARRTGAHQFRIQVQTDPVFGPVILLGESTSIWNIRKNAVVALPPLNMALARYMVIEALASGKIRERELHAPLNRHALCLLLTKISQIIIENPCIQHLLINPVLMTDDEVRVLDVSIAITTPNAQQQLAIQPYPKELEELYILRSGREIMLRPIRPEDEYTHQVFDHAMSKEDRYKRYFSEMPKFTHEQLARLTQIDYAREMAFIATAKNDQGEPETLGVVRAQRDPDNTEAEFAIVVRSDMKGTGLGTRLLTKMVDYCRAQGTHELKGFTMLENSGMANLARKVGFTVKFNRDDGVIDMYMKLVD